MLEVPRAFFSPSVSTDSALELCRPKSAHPDVCSENSSLYNNMKKIPWIERKRASTEDRGGICWHCIKCIAEVFEAQRGQVFVSLPLFRQAFSLFWKFHHTAKKRERYYLCIPLSAPFPPPYLGLYVALLFSFTLLSTDFCSMLWILLMSEEGRDGVWCYLMGLLCFLCHFTQPPAGLSIHTLSQAVFFMSHE